VWKNRWIEKDRRRQQESESGETKLVMRRGEKGRDREGDTKLGRHRRRDKGEDAEREILGKRQSER
jgi:hypothetical protein